MSNIDSIIEAAKAKSNALVPAEAPPLPVMSAPSGGFSMSADTFLNPGGMECDTYIQVKDAGIKLHKDWMGFLDDFEATIDLSEVQYFWGVRKEVGSNVSYAKTYDGQSEARSGENFTAVVERFKRESQKPADPYRGADIPLTLTQAYADPKGKGPSFEADDVAGLSTSITGFKPFATFVKKLTKAGLGNATIKVKVTHSPRKNANNQAYGVCEFELIEVLDQGAIAA